ncbi:MAG TPA: hypothetical protein DDW80_05070 [Desulfovibrio sp.]|nr:hypothetical protein [Desulfovibrio sp.]
MRPSTIVQAVISLLRGKGHEASKLETIPDQIIRIHKPKSRGRPRQALRESILRTIDAMILAGVVENHHTEHTAWLRLRPDYKDHLHNVHDLLNPS